MVKREQLFDGLREAFYGGKLTQGAVNGINAILDACEAAKITSRRQIAYILATSYHETAKTMQPVEEYGRGKGRKYGSNYRMDGMVYNTPRHFYYGRGHVQLTWYENYDRIGKLLKLDLLNNPAMALENKVSARILVEGMQKGWFTGKKLSDYINDKETDYWKARKIVNGLDQSERIANYAIRFFDIIEASWSKS